MRYIFGFDHFFGIFFAKIEFSIRQQKSNAIGDRGSVHEYTVKFQNRGACGLSS